jgi:hypothetical protein
MIVAGVVLAIAVVTAVMQPGFPVKGSSAGDGAAPVLTVSPSVALFPAEGKRTKNVGVWLTGAGLEAGQEFSIRIRWNSESLSQDVTAFMVGYDEETGAVANVHGAFIMGFGQGMQDFREARRDLFFQGVFETISFRLHDAATGDLLAVAPLGICPPARGEKWCNAAEPLLPLK